MYIKIGDSVDTLICSGFKLPIRNLVKTLKKRCDLNIKENIKCVYSFYVEF